MKKLFVVVNLVMLAAILLLDIGYMTHGGLGLKAVTSLMFVVTGVINLVYCLKNKVNTRYPVWMVVALVTAMLGDVLLGINFYLGAAFFALGHVFYFLSYCTLIRFNRRDLLLSVCIFLISLGILLFVPVLRFDSALMQGVCIAYALVISFMVGKAVSNLTRERNAFTILVAVGSFFFYFSDFMLVLNRFGGVANTGYWCLSTYYPAQFLLAFSLFVYAGLKSGAGREK